MNKVGQVLQYKSGEGYSERTLIGHKAMKISVSSVFRKMNDKL